MVNDEQAERALDYLRLNANKAAKARAERVYCEEFRKTIKSLQMQEHEGKAIGIQERNAYASPEYQQHLVALKDAVQMDEACRWGMVAAQATLDAWRTQQANKRTEAKIF